MYYPSIIIGIGGTGKWVITDIKYHLMKKFDGALPENVTFLSCDLTSKDTPPIIRYYFNLEKGEIEEFFLDYNPEKGEFINFSAEDLFEVINSIKSSRHEYPYIEKWFTTENAQNFSGRITDIEGAGQIRPLSRISFFINSSESYRIIYNLISKIAGLRGDNPVYVFIVSSLAGGTGCGTFIDFTNLVSYALEENNILNISNIFGCFILPKGFEGTINDAHRIERFKGNCFSAFREMHRFITIHDHKFNYSEKFKISQKAHLFDMVYLIDGTTVSGQPGNTIPHYFGVCPAISDFILSQIDTKYAISTQLPNIKEHNIKPEIRNKLGSFDASIYSTFGIHKFIFEIDDLILDFAHRLGKDILDYFIKPSKITSPYSVVQSFMHEPSLTPLIFNFLYQTIENPGTVFASDKSSLFNYLKFQSVDEDINLPQMNVEGVDLGTTFKPVKFEIIKKQVDSIFNKLIGSSSDFCTPQGGSKTIHGILNYYKQTHIEKFKELLKNYLLEKILNSTKRESSLYNTKEFLSKLKETFEEIDKKVQELFDSVSIEDNIAIVSRTLKNVENKKKKKSYCSLKVIHFNYTQHQLLMNAIKEIIDNYISICNNILEDIKSWIETFKLGTTKIDNSLNELKKARNHKRNIKIWTFLTAPNDEIENTLYNFIIGNIDVNRLNDRDRKIYEKLPQYRIEDLVNPNNNYFVWVFDHPDKGKDLLSCTLPEDFEPFEKLKSDAIVWNYNFINNYLKIGNLNSLKDSITIMDILYMKNISPEDFIEDINKKTSILADYSETCQASGKGETNIQKIVRICSRFTSTEPGSLFAYKLQEIIKNKMKDYSIIDNIDEPYNIIIYRIHNLIKYLGFSNLESLINGYRELSENETFHIFPEEKNAVNIENKFKSILNEEPYFLDFRVVDILGDLNFLIDIIYAFYYKENGDSLIKFNFNQNSYTVELEEMGENKVYNLNKTRVETIKALLTESEVSEKLREVIKDYVNKIKNNINSVNLDNFIKKLEEIYRSINPDLFDTKNKQSNDILIAERDLLKVFKVLLYNEINNYKERKKYI